MAEVFNPKNMAKLDNPGRRALLPPVRILKDFGLCKDHAFLDVGAGIGYFALPALDIVGKKGCVFAVDSSIEMLEELKRRAGGIESRNLKLIRSTDFGLGVQSECADLAMLSMVLHEVEGKSGFLHKILDSLKPGGELMVIEWEKRQMDVGPPLSERLSRDECETHLKEAGFRVSRHEEFSGVCYGMIGTRSKR